MKFASLKEEENELQFVREAVDYFAINEHKYTYTEGEIEPGALFAVRFGLDNDCVVVFKIDSEHEVINYEQAIQVVPF